VVICLERGADCLYNGPADATASQNPIILNSDWFYLSGTGLPMLSWKRPLNGCSGGGSSSSSSNLLRHTQHKNFMSIDCVS